MKLTNEQEKEMKRVFPNGYEESDIPAFIRERDKKEFGITISLIENGGEIAQGSSESFELAEMELGKLERWYQKREFEAEQELVNLTEENQAEEQE